MEKLSDIVQTFQGKPVMAFISYKEGMDSGDGLDGMDGMDSINLRQFPNDFCEVLGRERKFISQISLIVGDYDDGYEIKFVIRGGAVKSTITYHAVDCDQDPYDGHYTGSVVNENVVKSSIKYLYEYRKWVIIPVDEIAAILTEVLCV